MTTETDSDIRREAIINAAVEQVRALLETHFRDVTKAACDSFVGDDNTTEPVASASVSVKWSALAAAPKIAVKIGWSVKYSDESETEIEIDPLQSKLGLEPQIARDHGPSEKVKALAARIESAGPATKRAMVAVIDKMRSSGASFTQASAEMKP
jgi:hypothetical protein